MINWREPPALEAWQEHLERPCLDSLSATREVGDEDIMIVQFEDGSILPFTKKNVSGGIWSNGGDYGFRAEKGVVKFAIISVKDILSMFGGGKT